MVPESLFLEALKISLLGHKVAVNRYLAKPRLGSGYTNFTNYSVLSRWLWPFTAGRMLYRASKDGYSNSKFHQLCDSKGPLLIVLKLKGGSIVGGFTSINISAQDTSVSDKNAFLFKLSDGKPAFLPVMFKRTGYSQEISMSSDTATYGISFGEGPDLYIDFSQPGNCDSYLGCSFSVSGTQPNDDGELESSLFNSAGNKEMEDIFVIQCSPMQNK